MKSNVMVDMDEIGAPCPYPASEAHGVVHELMGMMGLAEPQGIDHQGVGPFQIGQFRVGDGLHVGNVGQRTDTVAQDGKLAMHHLERHDIEVTYLKTLMGSDVVQMDGGDAGVLVNGETIGNALMERAATDVVSVDIDVAETAIGAQVVHPSDMVVVGMGDEHSVNLPERLLQKLLAEVGTAVDKQPGTVGLHQCGTSQPAVMRVPASTYFTFAT